MAEHAQSNVPGFSTNRIFMASNDEIIKQHRVKLRVQKARG